MKNSNHRLHKCTLGAVLTIGIGLASGCQEELTAPVPHPDGEVSFEMILPEGWNVTKAGRGAVVTDSVEVGKTPYGGPIRMYAEIEDGIRSNTGMMTRASGDINSFGVYAYTMESASEPIYQGISAVPFMTNAEVTYSASNGYTYSPVQYWPGPNYWLKFFAYSPFKEAAEGLTVTSEEGIPHMTYTVPAEADRQVNLLAATPTDMIQGNSKEQVNLTFNHLLSAVNFKVGGKSSGYISTFGVTGVKNAGDVDMTGTAMTGKAESGTADFTQEFSDPDDDEKIGLNVAELSKNGDAQVGETFYMIPQTFDDETARLTMDVTFAYENRKDVNGRLIRYTYDFEQPLNKFTDGWDGNKTYSYIINIPTEVHVDITDKVVDGDGNETDNSADAEVKGHIKKDLVIKNDGFAPVYIRVAIVGYWVNKGTREIVKDWVAERDGHFVWGDAFEENPEGKYWVKSSEGFYHYMAPLSRGGMTENPLFQTYAIKPDSAPYEGTELELTIAAQVVIASDIDSAGWEETIVNRLLS